VLRKVFRDARTRPEKSRVADASRYRTEIRAVDQGARPMWSVLIPTYNCAAFLRETLASVLAQDQGPDRMQIEVVDDHSTEDAPESIVRELAGDGVQFYRQPENGGHVNNLNTCLRRSRGMLVHILHGDDQVRDGFYTTMERPFREHPAIGAAWCRQIIIDEEGRWVHISKLMQPHSGVIDNWLARIAVGQQLQTPAMVVRREVYERLGGFDRRAGSAEDWEMWIRIAARYAVWHEVDPLALYRLHRSSLSGVAVRNGAQAQAQRRVIEISRQVLPPDQVRSLTRRARIDNALGFLRRAMRLLDEGELKTPMAQGFEGLRFSLAPSVLVRAAILFALWCRAALRRLGPHA